MENRIDEKDLKKYEVVSPEWGHEKTAKYKKNELKKE